MRAAIGFGLRLSVVPLVVLLGALLVGSGALTAHAATSTRVDTAVTPQGVAVTTTARVDAPLAVIWQTLTDYDHLADFIPGMTKSRTVSRSGSNAVVEQTGKAGSLLFSYPIDIVVLVDEHPPTGISVHLLGGNLRTFDGGYRLEPVAGVDDSFFLSWSGVIEPEFSLPSFITSWTLRQSVEAEFRAMIAEIERRAALHRQLAFEVVEPTPCAHLAQIRGAERVGGGCPLAPPAMSGEAP